MWGAEENTGNTSTMQINNEQPTSYNPQDTDEHSTQYTLYTNVPSITTERAEKKEQVSGMWGAKQKTGNTSTMQINIAQSQQMYNP